MISKTSTRQNAATRKAALVAAALFAGLAAASAQSNDASNPALNTGNTAQGAHFVAPSALAKGASSFTEGEAQSRLSHAGLANVADLKKGPDGIWRGKATRDGKTVSVGLDFKGAMSAE